ncbi:DNA-binding MarR family transcriptional regulator [Donghicola tyrosinivorans]|uniref:DNA-binding MarR family transcriptional regulator n=2 Tax=Donghicola tyrosinivorans TaxID=1652492 RepID=A0A2T0WPR8_9RHOB|nr:DNA-binding MarR family transcriptional regulator [Donghicola tyrosinivorans]
MSRLCNNDQIMTQLDLHRLDDSLIALRRILRATELYSRDLAQSAGLTPAQLRVLQIAKTKDGSVTPKELATQMGVSQATVTALVDKIVSRGLAVRVRSETDRRQTNVTLTQTGTDAVAQAPDALQQRYVKAFMKLQDWEQAQLLASLERVAAMLNADDIDAAPVLTTGELKGTPESAAE